MVALNGHRIRFVKEDVLPSKESEQVPQKKRLSPVEVECKERTIATRIVIRFLQSTRAGLKAKEIKLTEGLINDTLSDYWCIWNRQMTDEEIQATIVEQTAILYAQEVFGLFKGLDELESPLFHEMEAIVNSLERFAQKAFAPLVYDAASECFAGYEEYFVS